MSDCYEFCYGFTNLSAATGHVLCVPCKPRILDDMDHMFVKWSVAILYKPSCHSFIVINTTRQNNTLDSHYVVSDTYMFTTYCRNCNKKINLCNICANEQAKLAEYKLKADLDLIEGSMTVLTTRWFLVDLDSGQDWDLSDGIVLFLEITLQEVLGSWASISSSMCWKASSFSTGASRNLCKCASNFNDFFHLKRKPTPVSSCLRPVV